MDRRTFLKSTTAAAAISAGAAAATAGPQPAPPLPPPHDPAKLAAAHHRWRIMAPADEVLRDAAIRLVVRVEAASAGRIAFEWVEDAGRTEARPGIGPGPDAPDAAFGLAADLLAAPHLALFTGLPADYGLPPQDLLAWHTIAGGSALFDEAAAACGAKVLIAGHSGKAPGLWADGDAADLRAFCEASHTATGLAAAVIDRLRAPYAATAATAAPAESGRPHIVERPAEPVSALAAARGARQTIWFRDGFHDHGTVWSLLLSRASWDRLDAGLQTLVDAVALAEAQATLAGAAYHRRAILPTLVTAGAITARPLPDLVRHAIKRAAGEIIAEHVVSHPDLGAACAAYDAFGRAMTDGGRTLPLPPPAIG